MEDVLGPRFVGVSLPPRPQRVLRRVQADLAAQAPTSPPVSSERTGPALSLSRAVDELHELAGDHATRRPALAPQSNKCPRQLLGCPRQGRVSRGRRVHPANRVSVSDAKLGAPAREA